MVSGLAAASDSGRCLLPLASSTVMHLRAEEKVNSLSPNEASKQAARMGT